MYLTSLRAYPRLLGASGAFRPELMHIVPTIPQCALPRHLPAGDVERMIASCDASKPHDVLERAILLLLSRLGLRVGHVLELRPG